MEVEEGELVESAQAAGGEPAQAAGGAIVPLQWSLHPHYLKFKDRKFKLYYIMKEELGKGGFGVVRRCVSKQVIAGEHEKTKEMLGGLQSGLEFAVKVNITPDKMATQTAEADLAFRLSEKNGHPNIVNLFDFIPEGELGYIISELANGGDLNDELIKKEHFTADEAKIAIKQILMGVNHIHERGLLHRDLKPLNILIKSRKVFILKITDFGLCVNRSRVNPGSPRGPYQKHAHGGAGTPSYKPPEGFGTHDYDTDYDVWSCGVILYQLLAGYVPFWELDNNALPALVRGHAHSLLFPRPEWDGLDIAENMIRRMITDQNQRSSIDDLLQHQFIADVAVPQPPVPEGSASQRYEKRRTDKLDLLHKYKKADFVVGPNDQPQAVQLQPGVIPEVV